jgi:hypothetical protein
MPASTKRLACYENLSEVKRLRVFHFFTIEAKKSLTSSDDAVAKRQSLNNASQALHNMFEFFKDASQESQFFAKVGFFSAVASTEGLTIRIHRATQVPIDGSILDFIVMDRADYPLRFEYREFFRIQKDNFDRKIVFEIIKKILVGYGAAELFFLLEDAAKAIVEKLSNNPEELRKRGEEDFYRYGQTCVAPSSRKRTPGLSKTQSLASVDMFSRAETPILQGVGAKRKRPTGQSDDGVEPVNRRRRI